MCLRWTGVACYDTDTKPILKQPTQTNNSEECALNIMRIYYIADTEQLGPEQFRIFASVTHHMSRNPLKQNILDISCLGQTFTVLIVSTSIRLEDISQQSFVEAHLRNMSTMHCSIIICLKIIRCTGQSLKIAFCLLDL